MKIESMGSIRHLDGASVKYEFSDVADPKILLLELNNIKSTLVMLDISTSALISTNTDLPNELIATKGELREQKAKLDNNQTSLSKLEATMRIIKLNLEVEKQKSVMSSGERVEDVLKEVKKDLEEVQQELAVERKTMGNTTSHVIADMLKDPTSVGYKMLRQSVMTSVKSNL